MAEKRRKYIGVLMGDSEVGPIKEPQLIVRWGQFIVRYGGVLKSKYLGHAVNGYLENGGQKCYVVNMGNGGIEDYIEVLDALDAEGIAYVAAPGITDPDIQEVLLEHCEKHVNMIAILDLPEEFEKGEEDKDMDIEEVLPVSRASDYRLCFYPWLLVRDYNVGELYVPPSGHAMGVMVRNAIKQRTLNPELQRSEESKVEGTIKAKYNIEGELLEHLASNDVKVISYDNDLGIGIYPKKENEQANTA
ncbi:MAG: hypothetical protein V3T58_07020 [Candidatus Hydrothermarchaeales archaeon]